MYLEMVRPIQCQLLLSEPSLQKLLIWTLVLGGILSFCIAGVKHSKGPEVLELTPATQKIIRFFEKSNHSLETKRIGNQFYIRKHQTSCHRQLFLRMYLIEHIPDEIDPGLHHGSLHIIGYGIPLTSQAKQKKDIIDRLAKILTIFSTSRIQTLTLAAFDMVVVLDPHPTKTPLYIRTSLALNDVSSSFVTWLGARSDFSTCSPAMGLKVHMCPDLTSLECLDALNFSTLSFFAVSDLKNLKDLACQILTQSQVTDSLGIKNLGHLTVTPNLAQVVAERSWEDVDMSISLWLAFFSAQPTAHINTLYLEANTIEETLVFENHLTPFHAHTTCVWITLTTNVPRLTQNLFACVVSWGGATFAAPFKFSVVAFCGLDTELSVFLKNQTDVFMATFHKYDIVAANYYDRLPNTESVLAIYCAVLSRPSNPV
ncbi:hypothetical protein NEDG_00192 [Nematocida displodere]|uniref:Uncharacterized protein n=1 Tax=Nematocida displodere TaxID=1805483 RepID=A0A177EIF5_9MICR|nr:hypothetical protein NEDG_00192 [Nematocida displodere]